MIRVDNAGTRRLSLITAQNGAQCVVGGSAYDTSTGSYSDLAPTLTTISSATTTSIDTAPASGCINDYDYINIKNTFAGSHTMTLQITSGSGGPFVLRTFTLLQNEALEYTHGNGCVAMDVNGNRKEVTASTFSSVTVTGDASLGTVSGSAIATQANQESASATNLIVTPGRQQFHPSAVKGWIKCDYSGATQASYNVTSITDVGVGLLTVTWDVDFSSANYCVWGNAGSGNQNFVNMNTQAAGSIGAITWRSDTATVVDAVNWYIAATGDQ